MCIYMYTDIYILIYIYIHIYTFLYIGDNIYYYIHTVHNTHLIGNVPTAAARRERETVAAATRRLCLM